MNNINFINISEFEEYRNENMKLSSGNLFNKYLSKIYINLIQREDQINQNKLKKISRESNNRQNEINLSLNIFLEYIDIQEFIGQRIFKFLNKTEKSERLSKNDFCEGLNHLYFGNINDLIKFTFFLADYNNDGKIYKTDMKQILSYIPCMSEFSQKNYVKQINKIINNFFDEKKKNDEIIYTETEQEINLEIFTKYIMEYSEDNKNNEKQGEDHSDFLNEYDFNAPFFYFISIISYIFKNLPFNIKTVEYFSNFTNKKKMKLSISSINKNNFELSREQKLLSTDIKRVIIKNNKFFRSTLSTTHKKNINNSNHNVIKEALPKIGKTNLFSMKKSDSQILFKKQISQKSLYVSTSLKSVHNLSNSINKYENIISKKKDLSDPNLPMVKLRQKEKKLDNALFRQSNKYNKKKLSPIGHDNLSSSTTKNTSVLVLNKSNSNDIREKYLNLRQKLPSISVNQKKYSPVIGLECSLKWKEEIKNNNIEEPEEFMLCEYSDNDDENRNSLCVRDSNISDNIFQLNEAYLYKHKENDIFQNNGLEKYYALIKEKELLFFSSEQKTELLDIWYINKSFISTGKESIKKQNYYTIHITYENNFIKKLFFLNENVCQNFSLSLKNAIKDYNFNDYYDLMNSVGEGHFGKVYKCKDKKNGNIYAAKIIDKTKLKKKDLDLIRQEKIILKLIKHENIISLKDYFEDKQNIYFISEFYEGGDLLNYIEEKQKMGEEISEKNSARIIRKIAQGLSYLNFFGIIHRDLKPENIMFEKAYNFKTLKIIDLGICKILSYGEKAKEPIGTNGYISPEIYLNKDYSFKADIWSLGVILYLLITGGVLPFDDVDSDMKNLAKKVCYLQQEYPGEYFGNKSKRLINLLDKMLEKNENKRITINNLMIDCWFDIIKK